MHLAQASLHAEAFRQLSPVLDEAILDAIEAVRAFGAVRALSEAFTGEVEENIDTAECMDFSGPAGAARPCSLLMHVAGPPVIVPSRFFDAALMCAPHVGHRRSKSCGARWVREPRARVAGRRSVALRVARYNGDRQRQARDRLKTSNYSNASRDPTSAEPGLGSLRIRRFCRRTSRVQRRQATPNAGHTNASPEHGVISARALCLCGPCGGCPCP